MAEDHFRSVIKAVSWRITGTLDTIILSWIISGTLKIALSIGAAELFTKIALFYLHERIWLKISFGRKKDPEYNI
ncbi:MAG: DUF2061 domain-containing protein [Candidatus Hydrogenedentota bacterium]